MVTCDSLVYRVLDIYGLKITASGIIFSFCFLLATITTEVYGYKYGGRIIWIIVFCQTIYTALLNIFSIIQPTNNHIAYAYHELYGSFWRVMIGTWVSVPISYFCNGFIVSKLKIFFNGRFFFIRYTISVAIAQFLLLVSAYSISISSMYKIEDLILIIATTWSYKVIMSIVLLPIGIYLSGLVKRIEGVDYYDWSTSYNPFNVFKTESDNLNRNTYRNRKNGCNSNN